MQEAGYVSGSVVCVFLLCPLTYCVFHTHSLPVSAAVAALPKGLNSSLFVDRKELVLESAPFAAGGFAQIFRGTYKHVPIALKEIHAHLVARPDQCAPSLCVLQCDLCCRSLRSLCCACGMAHWLCREEVYMARFRAEAELMASLRHPHIQGLFGARLLCPLLTCTPLPPPPLLSLSLLLSYPPSLHPRCLLCIAGACVFPFALITEYAKYGSLSDVIGCPPLRPNLTSCAYALLCHNPLLPCVSSISLLSSRPPLSPR